jgi:hypothetical protein
MIKLNKLLVVLSILYICTASLVSCISVHSISFDQKACIKPFHAYDYLTCKEMSVMIDGQTYVIPKNFSTDLASIPRPLWPILSPRYSAFVYPAILHDYLYSCNDLGNRKWADQTLYSALISEGVSRYTATKFYLGVRLFGGRHYDKRNSTCVQLQ